MISPILGVFCLPFHRFDFTVKISACTQAESRSAPVWRRQLSSCAIFLFCGRRSTLIPTSAHRHFCSLKFRISSCVSGLVRRLGYCSLRRQPALLFAVLFLEEERKGSTESWRAKAARYFRARESRHHKSRTRSAEKLWRGKLNISSWSRFGHVHHYAFFHLARVR